MRISAKAQLISRAAVPLDIHSTRLRAAVALTAALVYLLVPLVNSVLVCETISVDVGGWQPWDENGMWSGWKGKNEKLD